MAATSVIGNNKVNDDDNDNGDVAAAADEVAAVDGLHLHRQKTNFNTNTNNRAESTALIISADADSIVTITCASCKVTVQESDNRRRTICPHCGNFLSEELEREVRMVSQSNNNAAGKNTRGGPSTTTPAAPTTSRTTAASNNNARIKSSRGGASGGSTAVSRVPTAHRSKQSTPMSQSTTLPRIEDNGHQRTTPSNNQVRGGNAARMTPNSNSTMALQVEPNSSAERSNNNNNNNGPLQALRTFFRKLGPNNSGGRRGGGDENSKPTPRQQGQQPPTRLPPLTKSTSSSAALNAVPPKDNNNNNKDNNKPAIVPVVEKRLSVAQLETLFDECKESTNWDKITEFFQRTFSSVVEINAIFKDFEREKDARFTLSDACIKQDLLKAAYRILEACPKEIHSATFRSIIDLLVDNNKSLNSHSSLGSGRDDVRALLIVLQNPLFKEPAHSIVFAHLLRQISSITQFQHCLVVWLRHLDSEIFLQVTKTINAFITRRLFGDSTLPSHVLPPADKCAWWIPSGVKVLAIFNAANSVSAPDANSSTTTTAATTTTTTTASTTTNLLTSQKGVVPYSEFYNASLELLDLGTQYKMWLSSSGEKNRFSFCQYPFIMTLAAKRAILEADSEHQMVLNAQRSLIMDVVGGERVGLETFFLNLHIRRSFLLDDSIDELSHKSADLKKKLRVTFVGEPGLDVGGLTKEWFLLLMEKIFSPDYGMFTYNKVSGMFWLSPALLENFQEFHLVGVLMGLAVYNGIILDLRFPPILYRKLLSPAVCPFDNPNATVGVCQVGIYDLEAVFPDVATGLRDLIKYEGNVDEDFGLTFQISTNELGAVKTYELKRGGKTIPVTNANREEYVGLYVDWLLNRSIYRQFRAFYFGFHSVCASNAILLFRPEEIESLVCGNPVVDVAKLRRVTEYENGYSRDSVTVQHFWKIVADMPQEQLKRLLFFITSCTRVPIGCDLALKVVRADNLAMLPMAQTCFNRIFLPDYRDEKLLFERLSIALNNAEGFGIE